MIKITSSDKIIRLVSNYGHFKPQTGFILVTVISEKEMVNAYQILMTNKEIKEIFFYNENQEFLLNCFKSMFKVIEAAGGLVKNSKGEYLFIFRNGKWDLPKGKIEKNESIEKAAVREVEEECGIKGLSVLKQLETTYHTYPLNDLFVLKPTYWFEMNCSDNSELVPQLDEGITEARWISVKDLGIVKENTYGSILGIIAGLKS
jgi:ADP-ribose pyrophosphatase YjhB (NUDIX family)